MPASIIRNLAPAAWVAASLVALAGCGDGGLPSSEARAEAVVAEPVVVTPAPIPPNPITGDVTPEDARQAVFYRTDPEVERTDLTRLAEAQWRGPSNYTEWYFATRPMLDGRALGNLQTFTPSDWQAAEFHLDLFHTSAIDVPILSLGGGAGMAPFEPLHTAVRDAIADPTRDGSPRASDAGFRVRIFPGFTHFDLLLAEDSQSAGNPVLEEILRFALAHTEGEVLVPYPSRRQAGMEGPPPAGRRAQSRSRASASTRAARSTRAPGRTSSMWPERRALVSR